MKNTLQKKSKIQNYILKTYIKNLKLQIYYYGERITICILGNLVDMMNFCAPDAGFKATWIQWEHFCMFFHSLMSNSGKALWLGGISGWGNTT
jgi:hypothetical protein